MNDEAGAFRWLLDHAWAAVLVLIGVVWKQQGAAIKKQEETSAAALKAHAAEDERQFKSLHDEQQMQRGYIGKLFDELKEQGQRSEDRHLELLRELHQGLNSKADK